MYYVLCINVICKLIHQYIKLIHQYHFYYALVEFHKKIFGIIIGMTYKIKVMSAPQRRSALTLPPPEENSLGILPQRRIDYHPLRGQLSTISVMLPNLPKWAAIAVDYSQLWILDQRRYRSNIQIELSYRYPHSGVTQGSYRDSNPMHAVSGVTGQSVRTRRMQRPG